MDINKKIKDLGNKSKGISAPVLTEGQKEAFSKKEKEILSVIEKGRFELLVKLPFFSQVVLMLSNVVVDERIVSPGSDVPTFATDYKRLLIHPDAFGEKGMLGGRTSLVAPVILHECFHCGYDHDGRRGERDRILWNISADYAVNSIIKQLGFEIGEGWLYEEKYKDMCAEAIYDDLMKNAKQAKNMIASNGNGKQGNKKQEVIDVHMPASGEGKEKGSGGQGKEGKDAKENKNGGGQSVADLKNKWKDAFTNAKLQMAEMERAKGQGNTPGWLAELVDGYAEIETDVVARLAEFIKRAVIDTPNWKKTDRLLYSGAGLHWPTRTGRSMDIVFVADTSGSIGADDFKYFIGILNDILENFHDVNIKIRFMQCDMNVVSDVTVDSATHFLSVEQFFEGGKIGMKGRGGTSFEEPFWKIEEEIKKDETEVPSCLVYLTDGMGTFPKKAPDYPVLWVYNHDANKSAQPPFGQYTCFTEKQVKRENEKRFSQQPQPVSASPSM
ncbi:MAG: hypothetical protein DDT19_01033 [Syntrophomonadaceae bacterium]|nr:hypothetical protein [Bacillota bacterium]